MDDHTLLETIQMAIKLSKLEQHPVGSIYTSTKSTDPHELFGGTWEPIQDTFLWCAGPEHAAGTTGGSASITLTNDNLPSHSHPAFCSTDGNHDHISKIYSSNNANFKMATDGIRVAGQQWCNAGDTTAGSTGGDYCGVTTQAGAHSHTVSIGATGNGKPYTNMPPYKSVYAWERVK